MSATRNVVKVLVRKSGSDGFCWVERRSFGDASNLQRQCSTGELEFDFDHKSFVTVGKSNKDKRRPFKIDDVKSKADITVYIKDQRTAA